MTPPLPSFSAVREKHKGDEKSVKTSNRPNDLNIVDPFFKKLAVRGNYEAIKAI